MRHQQWQAKNVLGSYELKCGLSVEIVEQTELSSVVLLNDLFLRRLSSVPESDFTCQQSCLPWLSGKTGATIRQAPGKYERVAKIKKHCCLVERSNSTAVFIEVQKHPEKFPWCFKYHPVFFLTLQKCFLMCHHYCRTPQRLACATWTSFMPLSLQQPKSWCGWMRKRKRRWTTTGASETPTWQPRKKTTRYSNTEMFLWVSHFLLWRWYWYDWLSFLWSRVWWESWSSGRRKWTVSRPQETNCWGTDTQPRRPSRWDAEHMLLNFKYKLLFSSHMCFFFSPLPSFLFLRPSLEPCRLSGVGSSSCAAALKLTWKKTLPTIRYDYQHDKVSTLKDCSPHVWRVSWPSLNLSLSAGF